MLQKNPRDGIALATAVDLPGDGGGVPLDITGAPAEGDGAAKSEDCIKSKRIISVLAGVDTPQADGRVRALVMLTPKLAPCLKTSQRQLTCFFTTFLSPEQHCPCGLVTVLPACT